MLSPTFLDQELSLDGDIPTYFYMRILVFFIIYFLQQGYRTSYNSTIP